MAVYITAAGALPPGRSPSPTTRSIHGSVASARASERLRRRMLEANGIRTRHYALADGGHLDDAQRGDRGQRGRGGTEGARDRTSTRWG